jgi:hypothetical protein
MVSSLRFQAQCRHRAGRCRGSHAGHWKRMRQSRTGGQCRVMRRHELRWILPSRGPIEDLPRCFDLSRWRRRSRIQLRAQSCDLPHQRCRVSAWHFGENGGVRFYSMRNVSELGERVKTLLASPDALREAGELGRESVLASHTWRRRVGDIPGRCGWDRVA